MAEQDERAWKRVLYHRLIAEGRWKEAERFKDQIIKDCRAQGMKKVDARKYAWAEVERRFPPLPRGESPPAREPRDTAGEASAATPQNPDETLQQLVAGVVNEWMVDFRITVPDDAKLSLEAHVGRLVQDRMNAVSHASEGN